MRELFNSKVISSELRKGVSSTTHRTLQRERSAELTQIISESIEETKLMPVKFAIVPKRAQGGVLNREVPLEYKGKGRNSLIS